MGRHSASFFERQRTFEVPVSGAAELRGVMAAIRLALEPFAESVTELGERELLFHGKAWVIEAWAPLPAVARVRVQMGRTEAFVTLIEDRGSTLLLLVWCFALLVALAWRSVLGVLVVASAFAAYRSAGLESTAAERLIRRAVSAAVPPRDQA